MNKEKLDLTYQKLGQRVQQIALFRNLVPNGTF